MDTIISNKLVFRNKIKYAVYTGLGVDFLLSLTNTMILPHSFEIIETIFSGITFILVAKTVNVYTRKLKELENFVVQCAWCGNIHSSGEYVQAKISHSICPDCYNKEIGTLNANGKET